MVRISVIGMGFVGLCSAVCFADRGYETYVSTLNQERASLVSKGVPPFFEPKLKEFLQRVLERRSLKVVIGREEAILNSDISFITVGTPSNPDGSINLSYVRDTIIDCAKALRENELKHLIVIKSTVLPGTTGGLIKRLTEVNSGKKCGEDLLLCFNPEFLREGSAIYDTLHPDYIVIGECDEKSGDVLEKFYRDFYKDTLPPMIRTNPATAELIKYANNAFLATKISFINSIANICERIPEVDVTVVAKTIGLDERINPKFFNAGLGWGGSCLPKDIKALIAFSRELKYEPEMIRSVWDVNESQVELVTERIKKELGELNNKRIAILGLSFKPNTDDVREARSIKIIDKLLEEGAKIVAYDPQAIPKIQTIFGQRVEYAPSAIDCLKNADCCVLVTEWDEFKELYPEDFAKNMRRPILIDGRRIYDPRKFAKEVRYIGIGFGGFKQT